MKAIEYEVLIRTILSNMNEYIGNICGEYGIKYGQFEYFILILLTPGINQLEISRMKNVGKASVTKALKQLEEQGLIDRKVDSSDKRNILCFVSSKGNIIAKNLLQISSNVESKLFSGFSDDDMSIFYNYLQKLAANSENLLLLDNQ